MTDSEKIIRAVDSCFNYWLEQHRCLNSLELEKVQKFKADALAILKEQETAKAALKVLSDRQCEVSPHHYERKGFCPKCHQEVKLILNRNYCGFCGQKVKWDE